MRSPVSSLTTISKSLAKVKFGPDFNYVRLHGPNLLVLAVGSGLLWGLLWLMGVALT